MICFERSKLEIVVLFRLKNGIIAGVEIWLFEGGPYAC
jgi:hypothetical protein